MFVQVIQGPVADPEQIHAAFERWLKELAPGAEGWLGSTAGVTEDGTFVGLARFESQEAARRNSDRPEQDRWWRETSQLFTGEVTFRNSVDVVTDIQGNPDSAGFVQIIQGRTNNAVRAKELMQQDSVDWARFRPDVLGVMQIEHDNGGFTMAMYFTSEAEAREGERKEPPPELKAQMEEMDALNAEPPRFYDLKQPWLYPTG